jgi:hypothetical protein
VDIFETKSIQNYSSIVTHLGLVLHRSLHKLGLNFSYATTPFPKEAQELFLKNSVQDLYLPFHFSVLLNIFGSKKERWRKKSGKETRVVSFFFCACDLVCVFVCDITNDLVFVFVFVSLYDCEICPLH